MAQKPQPDHKKSKGNRDPISIRAARTAGKYAIAAAVVGAIVAAVATEGFGLISANRASISPTSAASGSATSAAAIDQRYDGKDPAGKDGPQSKCADPPASQPLTQVHPSVLGPDGRVVGYVDLRTSSICPVVWARVYWLKGSYRMPPGWSLHILVHRPADHKTIEYIAYDASTYVYGNMLATVSGCVYAEVYFAQGKHRTQPAVTQCMRSV